MYDKILQYIQGELSSQEIEELLHSLEQEPVLKEELLSMQYILGLTALLPQEKDKQQGAISFEKFAKQHIRPTRNIFFYLKNSVKYAAVIFLTVLMTWTYLRTHSIDKDHPGGYEEIYTPPGQRAHVRLQDGTSVWLNAQSTLRYPANFSRQKERLVELTGEAFLMWLRMRNTLLLYKQANGI